MKKLINIRIIVQFVLTSAWLICFGFDLIAYLVYYALLAFQYIIEINILKRENCSKGAIALIVADLLLCNIIPILQLPKGAAYLIPIILVNIIFTSYILTQLLEKREITMSQRVVMKRVYNVCTIVFIILLFLAAIAALIAFVTLMLCGKMLLVLLGLILISILVVVTYKSTSIARTLQERFAKYVFNAEGLWVPSLIIIAHIVVNIGMMFVCWLAWFGAIFAYGCATGYHG